MSDFLDDTGVQGYQPLIGALQWAFSIGRVDISIDVMMLFSFCAIIRVTWIVLKALLDSQKEGKMLSFVSKTQN
jgi:hypothetical protein